MVDSTRGLKSKREELKKIYPFAILNILPTVLLGQLVLGPWEYELIYFGYCCFSFLIFLNYENLLKLKLKNFYNKYPSTHHLYSAVNIWMYFLCHSPFICYSLCPSITHPSHHPFWSTDVKVSCRHDYPLSWTVSCFLYNLFIFTTSLLLFKPASLQGRRAGGRRLKFMTHRSA